MRSREDHLAWAKDLAMQDLRAGNLQDACATMVGRLNEHPETKCADALAMIGMMYVMQYDVAGMKRWIEGFR